MTGAAVNQPLRQHFSEAAKRSGDQIAALRTDRKCRSERLSAPGKERTGACDDDFADMFALRHQSKCRVNAARRKRTERKRRKFAVFHELGYFLQHLLGQRLVTGKDRIHGDDMKRRIPAQRPEWDSSVLIDIAFADFDEAAKFRETGK